MPRAWHLKSRPQGLPTVENFALEPLDLPSLEDGMARVANRSNPLMETLGGFAVEHFAGDFSNRGLAGQTALPILLERIKADLEAHGLQDPMDGDEAPLAEILALCRERGADACINYASGDLRERELRRHQRVRMQLALERFDARGVDAAEAVRAGGSEVRAAFSDGGLRLENDRGR